MANMDSGYGKTQVVSNPTMIEHGNRRFVIMDAPTDTNVNAYVDMLKKKNVVAVVRACDPSYSTAPMEAAGIKVTDLPFADGDPPPSHVVNEWLNLVEDEFDRKDDNKHASKKAIAVHCVAGLGRAPVLVCIALVESGMDPYDAISHIRKRRRGAINARQLQYIEGYKPTRAKSCCAIC